MKYVIVGKNMEVTQSLRDAVTQKLDKLIAAAPNIGVMPIPQCE